jgi:hypothetical protein
MATRGLAGAGFPDVCAWIDTTAQATIAEAMTAAFFMFVGGSHPNA